MHLYRTLPHTTQDICNFYVTETFKCLYFVQLLIYIFLMHFTRLMYKYMRNMLLSNVILMTCHLDDFVVLDHR